MLGLQVAVAIFLCLLPLQVNGLITANATCLPGFDWMFSSIGQSPCDVAEELLEVCFGGPGSYELGPLPVDWTYTAPTLSNENSCFCSSVVYSLLSACQLCQSRSVNKWSYFHTNCTAVYVAEYLPPIPDGVKVPAYAYQNVSTTDQFDSGLAQSMTGPESARLPSSTGGTTINSTPAVIGGVVVGGLIGFGLIVVLITFLVLRSKQKPHYDSNLQRGPNEGFISSITVPLPPGSPEKTDITYDPHRQHSPALNHNMTSEENLQNYVSPQMMSDERLRYSGVPEL